MNVAELFDELVDVRTQVCDLVTERNALRAERDELRAAYKGVLHSAHNDALNAFTQPLPDLGTAYNDRQ